MRQTGTSMAVPLAALVVGLIGYASLYPFEGWHWPAGAAGAWWVLPLPPWRDRFDMWANFLGYVPLGAVLYLAAVRSQWRSGAAAMLALIAPAALSYSMEVLQHFLPGRFPSLLDWALNAAGGLAGMLLAALAKALRWVDSWESLRARWFAPHCGAGLALLAIWPLGLLFPTPLPFGLGPSWETLQGQLVTWLLDVPWAERALAAVREVPQPTVKLPSLLEGLGVMVGLLAPTLLAYAVSMPGWRRLVLVVGVQALAFGAASLSVALNFGPEHALAWWSPVVRDAMGGAAVLALLLLPIHARLAATLGLLALTVLTLVVLQTPADAYFAQSLQAWEQGKFVRFHGLSRWVGWLWPLATAGWLLGRIVARWR